MNWFRVVLSVVFSHIVIFAFIMNAKPEASLVEAGKGGRLEDERLPVTCREPRTKRAVCVKSL